MSRANLLANLPPAPQHDGGEQHEEQRKNSIHPETSTMEHTLTPQQTVTLSTVAPQEPAATLFVVIVLHKMAAQDSPSFITLLAAARQLNPQQTQLRALLYDNSPSDSKPDELPSWVRYEAATCNRGLAVAYNRALALALAEGYEWLVTLDQDTHLPRTYFEGMGEIARSLHTSPQVAAILPQLIGDGAMLSPHWFRWGAIPTAFAPGFRGIPSRKTFAFNSGAALRVSALRQLGGYDPRFWLDYCDAHVFAQLHKYGKHVWVAGDLQLRHNFSMLDMGRRMTARRYQDLLRAEAAFWDLEMSALARIERAVRLVGRLIKHILRGDPPELRYLTLRSLLVRVFRSRAWRLRDWQQGLLSRFPESKEPGPRSAGQFPMKVSVCMATYNGEKFLRPQLESILHQLRSGDELIVVDDGSSDTTAEMTSEYRDSRIQLTRHATNQGVTASFEDAVRRASGDILFLSDQDDIWARDRVRQTLALFAESPDASLAVTNTALIDENGNRVLKDQRLKQRAFDSRLIPNLIANRFQGSAMAFRSQLLPYILPFPKKVTFLHDAWIGARTAWAGHETRYIDEPLLYYRRHGGNVSARLPIARKIRKRIELLAALALDSLARHFR